jgi:hypothetical protein
MFESALPQDPWVHIILEITIIEWQTYAIEPQACKELGICFGKEVLEEFVEENLVFLLSQHF